MAAVIIAEGNAKKRETEELNAAKSNAGFVSGSGSGSSSELNFGSRMTSILRLIREGVSDYAGTSPVKIPQQRVTLSAAFVEGCFSP